MTDSCRDPWHPSAAYLYVLHLDGPTVAWEYLRRHPDYRRDWRRHRRRAGAVAQRWGLHGLENPDLDARDAHPAWYPGPDAVQLHPDLDPPADAKPFDFWRIPGHKHLFHDGHHLALTAWVPARWQRFVLAPALEQGTRYVCACRDGGCYPFNLQTAPTGRAMARPGRRAWLELHTLQALDGMLAGASLREVAEALFGGDAVTADWHADGALRARIRRLVRRGDALMRGGYRRLLQRPPLEQGRLTVPAIRP
jgi:hypothetical protein